MNIEEDGKTYIKIKDKQEKSIIERNKVLEKLSKLEPLENEEYPIEEELEEVMKENKQLKEQLENKIDLYEDTISYQLGFDKGKEKYYQALLDIKEYAEKWKELNIKSEVSTANQDYILDIVNKAIGDKENE